MGFHRLKWDRNLNVSLNFVFLFFFFLVSKRLFKLSKKKICTSFIAICFMDTFSRDVDNQKIAH